MEKLPYNILLVDDAPIVLIGIGRELETQGFLVTTAESGEAALELLDEKSQVLTLL